MSRGGEHRQKRGGQERRSHIHQLMEQVPRSYVPLPQPTGPPPQEARSESNVTVLSWPGPSPDRGSKPADETKSRGPALQKRMGLLAVLQRCIKGGEKRDPYYKVKLPKAGKCHDRVCWGNCRVSRVWYARQCSLRGWHLPRTPSASPAGHPPGQSTTGTGQPARPGVRTAEVAVGTGTQLAQGPCQHQNRP